jgi:predicted enzyme related to lactoylglutathione lyase
VQAAKVSAVLFAKDLRSVTAFYSAALEMTVLASDEHHSRLGCRGFELVVHQIPRHIADTIMIEQPPKRRVWGAIRLDYPVHDIAASRQAAHGLGGSIDATPPEWADRDANFFFGYDPEGNQFGVSEQA